MFKLDLEKAEEPEIKLSTSIGSEKKQDNSRKTSTSASLTTLKPLTLWITTNYGKFLQRWEYQTTLPASFVAQLVKNLLAIQDTWVRSLGWEDPLEKGMASIPAWRIPWTEEPGGIKSMGSQRVGHD